MMALRENQGSLDNYRCHKRKYIIETVTSGELSPHDNPVCDQKGKKVLIFKMTCVQLNEVFINSSEIVARQA